MQLPGVIGTQTEAATHPSAPLTLHERARLRKRVSAWARGVVAQSNRSRLQLQAAMRQPDGWLAPRLHGGAVTFTPAQLDGLARILGVSIPSDVREDVERLAASARRHSGPNSRPPRVSDETIRAAGTAQREIQLLLDAAAQGRLQRERDLDWTLRRFGVDRDRAETLEEIGASAGVTRERVRQVEAKVMNLASVVAAGRRLPMLTSVHQRVLESAGLPWDAVEQELRPFLGVVPLRQAIQFYEQVQPPNETIGSDRASIYGLNNTLKVVVRSNADARFTSQVSTAARMLFSFAGAALVHDIRMLVESRRKSPVALRDVVRTLTALPELEWLDDRHRWCWFGTDELSALLRRAALILMAARVPVDLETLYAGLAREGRRDSASRAAALVDPVPPAHVVHAILKRHPDFRRMAANTFTYVGAWNDAFEIEPAISLIVQHLDKLGGAATRAELYELAKHPTHPIPKKSFAHYLYCSGRIERIGAGAWAIRGRPIEESRRREVLNGNPRGTGAGGQRSQVRPTGPLWSVELKLTEAARLRRMVAFPAAAIPHGAAGLYHLPDGHPVQLHQDRHGTRLTQLGPTIKTLLADAGVNTLRFDFNSDNHTISVRSAPD